LDNAINLISFKIILKIFHAYFVCKPFGLSPE